MTDYPHDPGLPPALEELGRRLRELERQERGEPDPWRLPALGRFGAQFDALETPPHRTAARGRRQRVAQVLVPVGVTGLILAVVLALVSGPAGALSVINQAPTAAAKSTAVQFQSVVSLTVGGRGVRHYFQTGQINFAAGDYQTRLNIPTAKTAIEWRTVAGVLYFSVRRQRQSPFQTTRWLAVRLTRAQRAKLASAPESDAFTDPLAVLRLLADIRAPVSRVGPAQIDGVPTTHYRLSTNLAEVAHASSGAAAPTAYRAIPATLDVWLDRQGRPRRVEETIAGSSPRGAVTLRTTIDFSGYGAPVAIQAPAGVGLSPTLRGRLPTPLVGTPSHTFERLVIGPGSRLP